ncbi:unnamed protein product [Prorocentrum cordatum]|uniref:Uncharacterized protein n=1 Tax=Prorocentrum cordatum TaxID=2364126 RepID=A0ABN9SRI3_9DINO|nr:unnamed protein product [Polarella glacialis]
MAKRAAGQNVHRFSRVVGVVKTYTKLRQAVRQSRTHGRTAEGLAMELRRTMMAIEVPILNQVVKLAIPRNRWANAKKRDDKMFVQLTAGSHVDPSVFRQLVGCSGRAAFAKSPDSLRSFIHESFKRRAICVTSERCTGVPATTDEKAERKHRLWCDEYTNKGFVEFPAGFGPGVHIGGKKFDAAALERVRDALNSSGEFRRIWGGRCKTHQMGQLICKVRQHVFCGMTASAARQFLARAERGDNKETEELCWTLAEFGARPGVGRACKVG